MTKIIKGYVEQKELDKWERGEWISMIITKHGNLVESDNRVPVVVVIEGEDVTVKDGLLWRDGKMIGLPEADQAARKEGYNYAEELVTAKTSGRSGR